MLMSWAELQNWRVSVDCRSVNAQPIKHNHHIFIICSETNKTVGYYTNVEIRLCVYFKNFRKSNNFTLEGRRKKSFDVEFSDAKWNLKNSRTEQNSCESFEYDVEKSKKKMASWDFFVSFELIIIIKLGKEKHEFFRSSSLFLWIPLVDWVAWSHANDTGTWEMLSHRHHHRKKKKT